MQVRCPKCGKFGSTELKNFCKTHYPYPHIKKKNLNTNHVFREHDKDFKSQGVFVPDSFGIVKDKFGIQDRWD